MSMRDEFRALHPAGSGPRVVIRKRYGLWSAEWSDWMHGGPRYLDGYITLSHALAINCAGRMWRERWGAEAPHE